MTKLNENIFWLRAEFKENEARTSLTPSNALKLIKAGNVVYVEKSAQRIFKDEAYQNVGCRLVETHTFHQAPLEAIILGLKELPYDQKPLKHRHLYFAHSFKHQSHAKEVLTQFKEGVGTLYDLEYLADDRGVRVCAFGYWAGYVGAALGLLYWLQFHNGQQILKPLSAFQNKESLLSLIKKHVIKNVPRSLVLGARGRSGRGAVQLFKDFGLEVDEWTRQHTAHGGPFLELLSYDYLVNCVLIQAQIMPFLTKNMLLQLPHQLKMIADVTCDAGSDWNTLPLYEEATTLKEPLVQVEGSDVYIMAIDYLPTLLPLESSMEFSDHLIDHLLEFEQTGVWKRANEVFQKKLEEKLNV